MKQLNTLRLHVLYAQEITELCFNGFIVTVKLSACCSSQTPTQEEEEEEEGSDN